MGKKECDICGKKDRQKSLKRINGQWICKKCYVIRRKNKRNKLKKEITIEKPIKVKPTYKPKIRGAKEKKISKSLHFYLAKDEKYVLYKKYKQNGWSNERIKNRMNEINKKMDELAKRLRKQNKSDKDINRIFKESLAKLCNK